jgi:hypothetical protein
LAALARAFPGDAVVEVGRHEVHGLAGAARREQLVARDLAAADGKEDVAHRHDRLGGRREAVAAGEPAAPQRVRHEEDVVDAGRQRHPLVARQGRHDAQRDEAAALGDLVDRTDACRRRADVDQRAARVQPVEQLRGPGVHRRRVLVAGAGVADEADDLAATFVHECLDRRAAGLAHVVRPAAGGGRGPQVTRGAGGQQQRARQDHAQRRPAH